jgi:uncharacterized membrane protein (DUF106 family)
MLEILVITATLKFVLSLPVSDALAIQNITIYEGDVHSNNTIFNSSLNIELFLLALLIIIVGVLLYKKITQKNLNFQSPVKELQNRMEVLETIIVNSDD